MGTGFFDFNQRSNYSAEGYTGEYLMDISTGVTLSATLLCLTGSAERWEKSLHARGVIAGTFLILAIANASLWVTLPCVYFGLFPYFPLRGMSTNAWLDGLYTACGAGLLLAISNPHSWTEAWPALRLGIRRTPDADIIHAVWRKGMTILRWGFPFGLLYAPYRACLLCRELRE